MTMTMTTPPVAEMRSLIDAHGARRVAAALLRALVARHAAPRPAVPDRLRADVGLPPVEREMRRHWEVR